MLEIEPITKRHIDLVHKYGSDRKISNTSNVPYPYTKEMANEWFETISLRQKAGLSKVFAISLDSHFVGVISLNDINLESNSAEIDYWISFQHQGNGFATAAIKQVVSYAKGLNITDLYSGCLARNKASITAQKKNGFRSVKTYRLSEGKFSGEEYVLSKLEVA